ncbi:MAG: TrmH family RNA methyltransferase [Nitrospiraceae bacterium]
MPPFAPIPSAKAALIRNLIRQKKARATERAFVVEGLKPILELLRTSPSALRAVVLTPACLEKNGSDLHPTLKPTAVPIYTCQETVFNGLTDVRTSQGILAVAHQPDWNEEVILGRPRLFGIYGECLQDPANVGAIIRTAAAFDVDAIWLSPDSADVFNPKVVRATAGTVLKLPVFSLADPGLFARHRCTILAAEPPGSGSVDLHTIRLLPPRTILALGNESRGLSEATLKQAANRVHIPVSPAVESLNVAASAAIALFYLSGLPRQDAGA